MLKILLLFALLIAGIVLGPMIAGHQGYVLIQTDNYNIETSVTGLVIILILAMVVLFAIEWLLRRIFRAAGLSAVNAVARVSKPNRRCSNWRKVITSRLRS
jgi:uncharacterized protein HemY